MIIFGQEDYVSRIKEYFSLLYPEEEQQTVSLRLMTDKADGTEFDFNTKKDELALIDRHAKIIVAVSMKFHEEAIKFLAGMGFFKLVPYTAKLDNEWKKKYFRIRAEKDGKNFTMIYDLPEGSGKYISLLVYRAVSIYDKPIRHEISPSPYICSIQVGAALTTQRIANVLDNTGDNISSRNKHFCETTALYWMWKNALNENDYLGLCHYRRVFVNIDELARKLRHIDVDVLLPLPTIATNSIFEDYLIHHLPDVWPVMMEVLQEMSPEYYIAAKKIFRERIFYASNMFIAKPEVINELCSWMFPIVFEIERRVGDLFDSYYNRYAGLVTERMITLFFLYNRRHWKITHVEKMFLY